MPDLQDLPFDLSPFFDLTPDLLCIAGKDGFFKNVNLAVIEKLGYSREELFASPIFTFIHPDDRERTARLRDKLLAGENLLNFENRYIAKTGQVYWLAWTSIYLAPQEIVFAIAKDITEKKEAEHEMIDRYNRYKELAAHFKTSIEKDRRYLAVELHEELAQLASVIKMDIEWIKTNVPQLSDFSIARIEHASSISTLLIKSLQRISFYLSPAMLHDVGLSAALEWHCREFSVLNGIDCSFENAFDEQLLSLEIKTDFFRICQEALNNVALHADAKKVTIRIEDADNRILLSITDNGKGFTADKPNQSFGLVNMQVRVASINGEMQISSEPGIGTKILVTVGKKFLASN